MLSMTVYNFNLNAKIKTTGMGNNYLEVICPVCLFMSGDECEKLPRQWNYSLTWNVRAFEDE